MAGRVKLGGANPRAALWSYWRRFESQRNVEKFLSEAGRASAVQNAAAISYCVKQASDLYRSASDISLLARPILLFYGMVALLKVIALGHPDHPASSSDIDKVERTGHGLKLAEWLPGSPWAVDLEKITVNRDGRGFFPFIEQRLSSGAFNECHGLQITVQELLGCVPEIADSYFDYYGRHPAGEPIISAQVFSGGFLHLVLRYSGPPIASEEDFFSRFPNLKGFVAPPSRYPYDGDGLLTPERNPKEIPGLVPRPGGGLTLVPPAQGYFFNRISVQYLLMYALSILARYKLDQWGALLEGRETGIGYLLYDFMDQSLGMFPLLVLERLMGVQVEDSQETDPHGILLRPAEEIYRELGHFEEYEKLRRCVVESNDREQRIDAVKGLSRFGESAALLRDLIQNDPDPPVRLAALMSPNLWVSSRGEDTDAVLTCLRSDSTEVRAHAARRLGDCRDPEVSSLLRELQSDIAETSLGRVCDVARDAARRIMANITLH